MDNLNTIGGLHKDICDIITTSILLGADTEGYAYIGVNLLPRKISEAANRVASYILERYQLTLEELDIKKQMIHNAREVYIGMDGFKPETAAEAYCLWILKQMYEELCDKPYNEKK